MTHPVHPKCPGCNKSLYKAFEKGKPVKKTDPWAFCRNPSCKLSGAEGLEDVAKARARAVDVEARDDNGAIQDHDDDVVARLEERKRFKRRLKAFKASRAAGDSWEETVEACKLESEPKFKAKPASESEQLEKAERFETSTATVTEYSDKKRRRARVAQEEDVEPKAVREARAKLKPLAAMLAPVGTERVAIGLILAILNQELGNKSGANQLIDEMGLDKLFGIEKF